MKHIKIFENFAHKVTDRDELMKLLNEKFPNIWLKKAEEFSKEKSYQSGKGIWTGAESSTWIDDGKKIPAFNPVGSYAYNPKLNKDYDGEVHKKLASFLKEHGYFAEFYDDATVFFWPIYND